MSAVLTPAELHELDERAGYVPDAFLHAAAASILFLLENGEGLTDENLLKLARAEAKQPGQLNGELAKLSDEQRQSLNERAVREAAGRAGDIDAKAFEMLVCALAGD